MKKQMLETDVTRAQCNFTSTFSVHLLCCFDWIVQHTSLTVKAVIIVNFCMIIDLAFVFVRPLLL